MLLFLLLLLLCRSAVDDWSPFKKTASERMVSGAPVLLGTVVDISICVPTRGIIVDVHRGGLGGFVVVVVSVVVVVAGSVPVRSWWGRHCSRNRAPVAS